ncbi:MAG: hypothetical protein Q7K29_05285 [Thermoleophilia bacterium]|nr:hypothetical protein [Thermoleophilia bacterium]
MTSAETHAANILKEIRRNVVADSALFGERLKTEAAMPESAGYSDLFMDACNGSADRDSGGADHSCRAATGGAASGGVAEKNCTIALGIEYIFEGYLLHYGESRLLGPDDGHFHLLAGDYMYARGLEEIAQLEDLACIKALAELVQVCSFIHCEKLDPGLAAKAWAVTALELAARVSSDWEMAISGMPAFDELEKLDGMLEELMDASLRERFSSIEAEFHGS